MFDSGAHHDLHYIAGARKVRVEVETVYVSDNPSVMVGQYLRGNLNVHIIIDDFL